VAAHRHWLKTGIRDRDIIGIALDDRDGVKEAVLSPVTDHGERKRPTIDIRRNGKEAK